MTSLPWAAQAQKAVTASQSTADEDQPAVVAPADTTFSAKDSLKLNSMLQVATKKPKRDWSTWRPDTKRAMWLAIVLPGAGQIYNVKPNDAEIKAGTQQYNSIVPYNQHASAFYGLAKAAGDTTQSQSNNAVGNYTDSAKSAISQMLNGSVAVTGSTPTITALSGIRYVCGEVATLDITLPASGIVDVVFESGATATVLTITPPTGATLKWANVFDPTSLDANTTYEINIADGLGVAASWT